MKKGIFFIFLPILIISCSQEAARVSYRENTPKTAKNHSLKPSYMKGSYVKTSKNELVRDLSRDDVDEDIYPRKNNSTAADIEDRQSARNVRVVTVRRGDTLFGLAKGGGCSIDDVIKLNNLKPPYSLNVGQKIRLNCIAQENVEQTRDLDSANYKYVIVGSGDTLSKIATNNGINLRELAKINSLEPPYRVNAGQKLKVPTEKVPTEYKEEKRNNIKNTYLVKPGDNLYSIAHENGVSFTELVRNNGLKKPYSLHVGQKLTIAPENESGAAGKYDGRNKGAKTAARSLDGTAEQTVERVHSGETDTKRPNIENSSSNLNQTDGIFLWPVSGEIIKNFGKQPNGNFNDAINIKAPLETKIKSVASGEVAYAGNELKGFGNIIIIKHENGWISVYGHCESISVKLKDRIQKGQVIGTVGKTGNVSEPQLYFSLRKGRIAVDPLKYFAKNNSE
ncbi:MAG: LysM peptidoglycan-binding domain-containing protein [Rickettsiales bacterium]|jgi:murein DD-endopeptidase MepM/ murein hydrolase activator NlpD|nr:LysM peptidoglycan-binding domain-containing protein [Rickettsiales bacterium]